MGRPKRKVSSAVLSSAENSSATMLLRGMAFVGSCSLQLGAGRAILSWEGPQGVVWSSRATLRAQYRASTCSSWSLGASFLELREAFKMT